MSLADWSVLVPFRAAEPDRVPLWRYVVDGWRATGVEVVTETDGLDGPAFSFSRGVNRCRAQASGRYLAVYGADHLPDPDRLLAAEEVLEAIGWVGLYDETAALSKRCSRWLLAGRSPRLDVEDAVPFCTGVLGVRADVWDDVGGFDPRFVGWGYEDAAFRLTLERLYGIPDPLPGRLFALWHAASPTKRDQHANLSLFQEYAVAANDGPEALRALIAATR